MSFFLFFVFGMTGGAYIETGRELRRWMAKLEGWRWMSE